MSLVWKVAIGLVAVLMLPVAAYAAGGLTAPSDSPTQRRDIVVDSPSSTKATDGATRPSEAEREARDRRRDRQDKKRDRRDDRDDVKVVTPQPTPVNDDDDGNDDRDDDDDDWED